MNSIKLNLQSLITMALILLQLNCSNTQSHSPQNDTESVPTETNEIAKPIWTYKSPFGGFISALAFHPSKECEVWASGDDMSGLYKSTDCGSTWKLVDTSKNFSAYTIQFDPTDSSKIYAPSHFGLGMLKSIDSGNHWSLNQAGLPNTINNRRAYQLAINPLQPNILIQATSAGLYRSNDSGTTFGKINISWEQSFQAVVYSPSGRLVAGGSSTGIFKYSDDNGDTWTDLFTGYPILEMHTSKSALYVLYYDGTLQYFNFPNFSSGGTINTPSLGISTGFLATLKVNSGYSQSNDKLFLGTSKNASLPQSKWGLFSSQNGGQSWTQSLTGLENVSIFRIENNPKNINQMLVASASGAGLFRSENGGLSFAKSDLGIMAISASAFAQNSRNRNELVLSNSVGLGMSRTYRSTDEGNSWSVVPEIDGTDGTLSFNFDPKNEHVLLAGMFSKGIYRSTNGILGPWVRVLHANVKISSIVRDRVNSNLIYALATGGQTNSDIRVYVSNDGGINFIKRSASFGSDISVFSRESEALLAAPNDLIATVDGFQSQSYVGLSNEATNEGGLTAVAINPANEATVMVGGARGGLYFTNNYSTDPSQIKWNKLISPIKNAMVKKIIFQKEGNKTNIYIASHGGDVFWDTSGMLGFFKSTDDGKTWIEVSKDLKPCTSFWDLFLDTASNSIWATLWGGGLFKYTPSVDP